MARRARLVISGVPHLVTHRALPGVDLFVGVPARRSFWQALRDVAREEGVAIHAYGLRSDHVRLLATPAGDGSLSGMMRRVSQRHAAAINRERPRGGAVWSGRFQAAPLGDDAAVLDAIRWVEADGVDLTEASAEHSSSAWHHLGHGMDPLVRESAPYWSLGNTPFERHAAHALLLARPLPEPRRDALAKAGFQGWPLGEAAWLEQLAARTARAVVPGRPGRPRSVLSPIK